MSDNESYETVLLLWQRNCKRSQIANYSAAARYLKRNYWLGIPTVVFSTIVGTSVFAALGEDSIKPGIQIAVGMISILSAVFAALQTFFKWGELAAKCQSTASSYGAVKRLITQLIAGGREHITEDSVSGIRQQMDMLAREGPELPQDIWQRVRAETAIDVGTT